MTKATENRRSRDPGEIWITSLVMTVDKKVVILVTVTAQLKPISKRMQMHSIRQIRINLPTRPLVKETRKRW